MSLPPILTTYVYVRSTCAFNFVQLVPASVQTTNLDINYTMFGSHFACRLLVQASQLSLDQVLWGTYRT